MHSRIFSTLAVGTFFLLTHLQSANGEDERPPDLRWASGWSLTGIIQDGKTSVPHKGESVSIKFLENRFLADFGVNGGGGNFVLGKTPGAIHLGEFGVTEMGGPPQLMKQEMVLVELLIGVSQYKIEEGELYLLDRAGKNGLKYKPVQAPEPLALLGPDWKLQYFEMSDGVTVSMERPAVANPPTIRFNKEGAEGTTGLRPLKTTYEGGFGEILKFGRLTPEGDAPKAGEEQSEFEAKYLGFLARISKYSVKGKRLTLSDRDGTVNLVYSPSK